MVVWEILISLITPSRTGSLGFYDDRTRWLVAQHARTLCHQPRTSHHVHVKHVLTRRARRTKIFRRAAPPPFFLASILRMNTFY